MHPEPNHGAAVEAGDQPPPQFLRFQAYYVGLPKTGSTTISEMLTGYRCEHELDMPSLSYWGIERADGRIGSRRAMEMIGARLEDPALEFDVCTSLHWHADELASRFPTARFVHVARDVRSWTQSLLDMEYRRAVDSRLRRRSIEPWEATFRQHFLGEADPWRDHDSSDEQLLVRAMQVWGTHMSRMREHLPHDRTLVLTTPSLDGASDRLAEFLGIPSSRVGKPPRHNTRPDGLSFDRWHALGSDRVRTAYQEHCAEHMRSMFPDEHAAHEQWARDGGDRSGSDWSSYARATLRWAMVRQAERAGPKPEAAEDVGWRP